jgi:quercetin dioxygenase-like cupin family protein
MAVVRVAEWKRAEAPARASLQAELEAEGYSVYVWTDGPGTTYPPHTHGDDQSHWIVSGAMALTVDGTEYVLRAGDRDWLPAGMVHSARVVGASPVTYLVGAKAPAD